MLHNVAKFNLGKGDSDPSTNSIFPKFLWISLDFESIPNLKESQIKEGALKVYSKTPILSTSQHGRSYNLRFSNKEGNLFKFYAEINKGEWESIRNSYISLYSIYINISFNELPADAPSFNRGPNSINTYGVISSNSRSIIGVYQKLKLADILVEEFRDNREVTYNHILDLRDVLELRKMIFKI